MNGGYQYSGKDGAIPVMVISYDKCTEFFRDGTVDPNCQYFNVLYLDRDGPEGKITSSVAAKKLHYAVTAPQPVKVEINYTADAKTPTERAFGTRQWTYGYYDVDKNGGFKT